MTCRVRNRSPGRIVSKDDHGLTPRVHAHLCTHTTWVVHSRTFHKVGGPAAEARFGDTAGAPPRKGEDSSNAPGARPVGHQVSGHV
jgi:hypothetical protein